MKHVKFVIKKKNGNLALNDTTVGKQYTGILTPVNTKFKTGENKGDLNTFTAPFITFTDDVGDEVNVVISSAEIEYTEVPAKPRVRLLSSGRRQFDVNFKMTVVRHCDEIRRTKKGGIGTYLQSLGITDGHLFYWRKQKAEGHFSAERAVAFSRKPTMIHG